MSGPFRDYPHMTVYHPNEGNAFANVGWPGFLIFDSSSAIYCKSGPEN